MSGCDGQQCDVSAGSSAPGARRPGGAWAALAAQAPRALAQCKLNARLAQRRCLRQASISPLFCGVSCAVGSCVSGTLLAALAAGSPCVPACPPPPGWPGTSTSAGRGENTHNIWGKSGTRCLQMAKHAAAVTFRASAAAPSRVWPLRSCAQSPCIPLLAAQLLSLAPGASTIPAAGAAPGAGSSFTGASAATGTPAAPAGWFAVGPKDAVASPADHQKGRKPCSLFVHACNCASSRNRQAELAQQQCRYGNSDTTCMGCRQLVAPTLPQTAPNAVLDGLHPRLQPQHQRSRRRPPAGGPRTCPWARRHSQWLCGYIQSAAYQSCPCCCVAVGRHSVFQAIISQNAPLLHTRVQRARIIGDMRCGLDDWFWVGSFGRLRFLTQLSHSAAGSLPRMVVVLRVTTLLLYCNRLCCAFMGCLAHMQAQGGCWARCVAGQCV